ncbi:MAG: hypothetical protein Q9221_001098 [Calogaya cf. arnoldii]
MAHHHPELVERSPGTANYLSPRTNLVDYTVELLLQQRIIIIRATPQTGKTTLGHLVSRKLFLDHPELEPVFSMWDPTRDESTRMTMPYQEVLALQYNTAKRLNDDLRLEIGLHVDKIDFPKTRVYIIDEAVLMYPETQMWDNLFKGPPRTEDNAPYFILLCLYEWGPIESQSATIPIKRRIELLAQPPHPLGIRMDQTECRWVISLWAKSHEPPAAYDDDMVEFLWYETEGHAGVLGLMLTYIKDRYATKL